MTTIRTAVVAATTPDAPTEAASAGDTSKNWGDGQRTCGEGVMCFCDFIIIYIFFFPQVAAGTARTFLCCYFVLFPPPLLLDGL